MEAAARRVVMTPPTRSTPQLRRLAAARGAVSPASASASAARGLGRRPGDGTAGGKAVGVFVGALGFLATLRACLLSCCARFAVAFLPFPTPRRFLFRCVPFRFVPFLSRQMVWIANSRTHELTNQITNEMNKQPPRRRF